MKGINLHKWDICGLTMCELTDGKAVASILDQCINRCPMPASKLGALSHFVSLWRIFAIASIFYASQRAPEHWGLDSVSHNIQKISKTQEEIMNLQRLEMTGKIMNYFWGWEPPSQRRCCFRRTYVHEEEMWNGNTRKFSWRETGEME